MNSCSPYKQFLGITSLSLILLLTTASVKTYSQEFVYVNTDNLILRDRPENSYEVLAILHAPCQLKVEKYELGYIKNQAIKTRFYQVAINYWDDKKYHHHIGGWVEKKYVVSDKDKITTNADDNDLELNASIVKMIPSGEDDAHNPNKLNWADYPAPKYKGGVNVPPPVKRVYHKGPKGGCYYFSKKGKKVYVNKVFCKGK